MIDEIIIPAAGLGTRMYPITQGKISKLMLKINSRPVISYAIDEAINSGFKKIYIVLNEDHHDIIDFVKKYYPSINMILTPLTKGNACSITLAKDFIKNSFFAVMMPDMIIKTKIPPFFIMKEVFEKYKTNILGFSKIAKEDKKYFPRIQTSNFLKLNKNTFDILDIPPKGIKSVREGNLISSRSILSRDFFEISEKQEKSDDIDVLIELIKYQKIIGVVINGKLFDLGNVEGYKRAIEIL